MNDDRAAGWRRTGGQARDSDGNLTRHFIQIGRGTGQNGALLFFLVNQGANGRKQDKLGRALVNTPNQGTLCTVNENSRSNEFKPHGRSD